MAVNQKKSNKKKFILLLVIIFSHILPVIVSAFYDKALRTSCDIKLSELRYWLWAFTWWSAWASLITVPWATYKFFTHQKRKSTYSEQSIDIIITETNLISGIIFCCGGFFLTIPTNKPPLINYPWFGQVKTMNVWYFYNLFWHVLAPGLVFYYFWKYCQVDKLEKKKKIGLMINLLNPTVYYFYVLIRPLLNNYPKNKSYYYPQDYPYAPFAWSAGKFASWKEEKINKESSSNLYFWHKWPTWLKIFFWLLVIFVFWYLVFSSLFYFLIKMKSGRKKYQKANT